MLEEGAWSWRTQTVFCCKDRLPWCLSLTVRCKAYVNFVDCQRQRQLEDRRTTSINKHFFPAQLFGFPFSSPPLNSFIQQDWQRFHGFILDIEREKRICSRIHAEEMNVQPDGSLSKEWGTHQDLMMKNIFLGFIYFFIFEVWSERQYPQQLIFSKQKLLWLHSKMGRLLLVRWEFLCGFKNFVLRLFNRHMGRRFLSFCNFKTYRVSWNVILVESRLPSRRLDNLGLENQYRNLRGEHPLTLRDFLMPASRFIHSGVYIYSNVLESRYLLRRLLWSHNVSFQYLDPEKPDNWVQVE